MRLVDLDSLDNLLAARFGLHIALDPIPSQLSRLTRCSKLPRREGWERCYSQVDVPSNMFRSGFQHLLSPSRDVHLCAIHDETLSDRLAESGATAGDYNDLALDGEEVLQLERDVLLSHDVAVMIR